MGLSPRVRGNHPSTQCSDQASQRRVYPRVCGGTVTHFQYKRAVSGSIPACAGEPRQGRAQLDGSIPACAGEPLWISRGGSNLKLCKSTAAFASGLSPRVRGNLPHRLPHPGLSPRVRPSSNDMSAKWGLSPRVRGNLPGLVRRANLVTRRRGLSPRVRGNHHGGEVPPDRPCRGSIPACAGEPSE